MWSFVRSTLLASNFDFGTAMEREREKVIPKRFGLAADKFVIVCDRGCFFVCNLDDHRQGVSWTSDWHTYVRTFPSKNNTCAMLYKRSVSCICYVFSFLSSFFRRAHAVVSRPHHANCRHSSFSILSLSWLLFCFCFSTTTDHHTTTARKDNKILSFSFRFIHPPSTHTHLSHNSDDERKVQSS